MAKYDYDLCVIGGGAAGLTVASGAARLGMRTQLAEREPALGGDCLHYGCVPSKTLVHIARVRWLMGRASGFGLPGVELPPVAFQDVTARIRAVIATIQEHDSVERFRSLGVEPVFGPARFTDEHEIAVAGQRVSAARFVVATGSSAALPPIPGLDSVPLLTNREIFSLPSLPASLVVLGAGAIACELGQAFARLGTRVTLVQRGRRILSKEDADMAEVVEQALRSEGLDIRTGCVVARVRPGGEGVEVLVERDGAAETVTGERLLVALGRRSNVEDLGLENAGVRLGERGVAVDARMRTSQRHIFAAGDVTGEHRFTHAAGYEGGIVVANAAMRLPRRADYTLLPRCTYTDPELAVIGMSEQDCRRQGVPFEVVVEPFSGNDRAQAGQRPGGRFKMLLGRRGKPLGVQIAGPHAGELIAEWVAALNGRVGLSTLAGAVHPYPTLAEISKKAAGSVYAPKIFSPRVGKILRFLFGYRGSISNNPK